MVATKCDFAAGMAADAAGRVEAANAKWKESWSGAGMTAVRVEDGVSLTSCFPPTPARMEALRWGRGRVRRRNQRGPATGARECASGLSRVSFTGCGTTARVNFERARGSSGPARDLRLS
ncbi:unnamed protein product [Ectocarpus sp. 12 AP-2014]